jgi:hypothetical protein
LLGGKFEAFAVECLRGGIGTDMKLASYPGKPDLFFALAKASALLT